MANLKNDGNGNAIQGFAPTRALAVTTDADAVFTKADRAFCVPEDCTYTINGGIDITLLAGAIRVIRFGFAYRFGTAFTLEVM